MIVFEGRSFDFSGIGQDVSPKTVEFPISDPIPTGGSAYADLLVRARGASSDFANAAKIEIILKTVWPYDGDPMSAQRAAADLTGGTVTLNTGAFPATEDFVLKVATRIPGLGRFVQVFLKATGGNSASGFSTCKGSFGVALRLTDQ